MRSRAMACREHDRHHDDPQRDRDVLHPERHEPVPGEHAAQGEAGEAGGDQREGDDDVERGDPAREHRLVLVVVGDREGQERAQGDEEGDAAGEGDPRQVVEELRELRFAVGTEGGDEPEDGGGEERDRGRGGHADHAVAQHRGSVGHAPHPLDDEHEDRDQGDAEPVEEDHAVLHPREVLVVELRHLSGRGPRRHRRGEAGEQEERGDPDHRDRTAASRR